MVTKCWPRAFCGSDISQNQSPTARRQIRNTERREEKTKNNRRTNWGIASPVSCIARGPENSGDVVALPTANVIVLLLLVDYDWLRFRKWRIRLLCRYVPDPLVGHAGIVKLKPSLLPTRGKGGRVSVDASQASVLLRAHSTPSIAATLHFVRLAIGGRTGRDQIVSACWLGA